MKLIAKTLLTFAAAACLMACTARTSIDKSCLTYESNHDDSIALFRTVCRPYPFETVVDTPAPKGYEPFYIAHYGRHGSRYAEKVEMFNTILEPLEDAESQDILTASGRELLAELREYGRICDGMYGQITELGAREHKMLAKRMSARFPQVFSRKDATQVTAVPSYYSRCILSMVNFTFELKNNFPQLQFSTVAGERYNRYINNKDYIAPINAETTKNTNASREKLFSTDRLAGELFTKPAKAERRYDLQEAFFMLYMLGCLQECLPEGTPDLLKWFNMEELRTQWSIYNAQLFARHDNCLEFKDRRLPQMYGLVADILDKANAAIDGNGVAADLRFGHDSALMVLMSILLEDYYSPYCSWKEVSEIWNASEVMPMASNLQIVLYRSDKADDVLVKLLYNEKEREIPDIEPVEDCYYRWSDFEARLREIIK